MAEIKAASTIMLGRDNDGVVEILLLKRNKALAFAGGLWVFPGGKVEDEEKVKSENKLEAAKLAAVRETQEEAAIQINIDSLIFFSHWTTPVIEPRRYSTWFFFSDANHLTSEVVVDDSEIKEHLWLNPQVALDKVRAGELGMMPPTIMSLQMIRKCKSVAEVRTLLEKEEPIFTLPILKLKGTQMICMYEGDAAYDSGKVDTIGARHRLVFDTKKGTFNFEFKDCENVKPINGGMHL